MLVGMELRGTLFYVPLDQYEEFKGYKDDICIEHLTREIEKNCFERFLGGKFLKVWSERFNILGVIKVVKY